MQLDVLRGVAVMMILLNHRPRVEGAPGVLGPLIDSIGACYWTGVDLFFVLSGYLVGGLLIAEMRKTGGIDLKRFWVRRGLKIWPSYYLYLAVLSVVAALFYVDAAFPGAQWTALKINFRKLFYVQNYFGTSSPPGVPIALGAHTWTLAVEEHFYVLLPLVLVASRRHWRTVLPVVSIGLLFGCLAMRLQSYHAPMDWIWDYGVTHKRIDSLFFGALLSFVTQTRPAFAAAVARRRLLLGAIGALLVSPMIFLQLGDPFVKTFGYTLLALGYGCILLSIVATPLGEGTVGRALASRPARALAWTGVWSYSIYVWHVELAVLFGALVARLEGRWIDLWGLLYVAASIGLGVIMARLVERPALAWRERYYPSRSPAPLPLIEPGPTSMPRERPSEALAMSWLVAEPGPE